MEFRVTSDRVQKVDGLGVFAEGETKVVTEAEMAYFAHMVGTPLLDALPEGIDVEVEMGEV